VLKALFRVYSAIHMTTIHKHLFHTFIFFLLKHKIKEFERNYFFYMCVLASDWYFLLLQYNTYHQKMHSKKIDFLGQGVFGKWHPAGDGKISNLFLQCMYITLDTDLYFSSSNDVWRRGWCEEYQKTCWEKDSVHCTEEEKIAQFLVHPKNVSVGAILRRLQYNP